MIQNTLTQTPSIYFSDPNLVGQPQVKILQLQFISSEVAEIDYIEIQIDGIRKVISLIT